MKIILITLCLIFISNAIGAQSNSTKIYVNSFYECPEDQKKNVETKLAAFEEHIAIKMSEVYPCAKINTKFEVTSMLEHFRHDQIIGSDSSTNKERWGNIASATTGRYLIAINLKVVQQLALINLMFIDKSKTETLFRTFISKALSSVDYTTYESMTKQLIDGIKTCEICPFKGSVKIKIVSTLKDEQKENHSTFCNGIDGTYSKTTTINNYSEINWDIEKVKIAASKGNVEVNLSEETVIDEINSCYECSPQKQGPRVYHEKTTTYATVQGLSKESESEGIKVDDARVELTFLDNGKYTLRLIAASNKSKKKTIKEVKAEGVCDNISGAPKSTVNQIDLGINELFGAFTGNAQNKVLAEKGKIERSDPNSKLKETITYEFHLERD